MNEGWKEGYKCVYISPFRELKQFLSICPYFEEGITIYRLDRPTYRYFGFGPFAVFGNLSQAREFMLFLIGEIYKCEYLPSSDNCMWIVEDNGTKRSSIVSVEGTVLADAVILREKVDRK